ncbi:MAG: hypothetical protein ACJ77K_11690 [Bacteroidia bacterium]|jgi:hypothetical protein
MKYSKGQLIKILFKDREPVNGIVMQDADDWILLRSNPADYVIDGYTIVRKHSIKNIIREDKEKWIEKVIKLKKVKALRHKIPLDNLEEILETLTKKFGIFIVYTKEQGVCWLGKLNTINEKTLVIDDLTPKAKWDGQMKFKTKEIIMVEFDTDYVNSLKLVLKNE